MSEKIYPEQFVSEHNNYVKSRDYNQIQHENDLGLYEIHKTELNAKLGEMGAHSQLDIPDDASETDKAEIKYRTNEIHQNVDTSRYHEDQVKRAETGRRAALWDAHEDYQNNQEAYMQEAIEDATAAGHDVNFGGQHYPDQTPEQPKQ